jgi:NADH-quinone oxidoreductase subunit E
VSKNRKRYSLTKATSFERIESGESSVTKLSSVQNNNESAQIIKETKRILRGYSQKKQNLIPILQNVQEKLGYLPREAMEAISDFLNIAPIDVYGVVTFYNQFRLNPPGKHSIRVCLGTACHMKGGYISLDAWQRRLNIKSGETTTDREFDLDTVACVGCCTKAPVTVVDGKPEGKVEPTRVDGILLGFGHEYKQKEKAQSESK